MSAERDDALDPLAWLARAASNLAKSRIGHGAPDVFLEDLVFDAQQAVEKALKALLVAHSTPFPKTHDLADLLNRLRASRVSVPSAMDAAVTLTPYAVRSRYPGGQTVTE